MPNARVTYPVVVVEVECVKCRALLGTGAVGSYASAALLNRIPTRKRAKEVRKIEMLLGTSTREVELLAIETGGVSGKFTMPAEVMKMDKGELLFLGNPNYEEILAKNPHLSGVVMTDQDKKSRLPVHLILGAREYAKLKTESAPKVGEPGEPVAELTKFGWIIMSRGKEPLNITNMSLAQTSHVDYEALCRSDVLGLSDTPTNDQGNVYSEFQKQLIRDEAWCVQGQRSQRQSNGIFQNACFTLFKWHSNAPELEAAQSSAEDIEEVTYAKQQLGSPQGTMSSILGLPWNKERDTVSVEVPSEEVKLTKRGILAKLAKICDPLGLISPETPRAGHMAVNLITNVREALEGLPLTSMHCWLDSLVALYWIRGHGEHKQFVSNSVQKINIHHGVTWRYVPSTENPADLANRGGRLEEADQWWNGPKWLANPGNWPADIPDQPTEESQAEAKLVRKVLSVADHEEDEIENVLRKFYLQKAVRVCAWMRRFAHNTLHYRGDYSVYLPESSLYSQRIVEEAHLKILHGEVGLTMTKVPSQYSIPKLGKLVKKVRRNCHGCKRFQAMAYAAPPPGCLPTTRTEGVNTFQVVGSTTLVHCDIAYRDNDKERRTFFYRHAALRGGVYRDLLPSLETEECLRSLKKFNGRRGRLKRIYSENGRTFVGAAKWVRTVMRDERLQNYLSAHQIKWQFNLSRAPWWSGQFERIIGLVKSALHKSIGNGMLSWKSLQEVLSDVETILNNRQLSYLEDDPQLPVLTPSSMLFVNSNVLPELQSNRVERADLRKRAKHLLKYKEAVW
ncbi:hypothetical protein AWC38_SpisGene21906 [Stylophora pistillata]|uniref:Integrase catalytic domain-containing protein n=2 Tax=Stylophora pistillata TaxID=50429 RepID=A0A2B4R9Z8_STYPI|nr:hypothetical protein AWC38_SpisGene21906 [Stylophora pistillata]